MREKVFEIFIIAVVLFIFVGIFVLGYKVSRLEMNSEMIKEINKNKAWQEQVTQILNFNMANKKLDVPVMTPKLPNQGDKR